MGACAKGKEGENEREFGRKRIEGSREGWFLEGKNEGFG